MARCIIMVGSLIMVVVVVVLQIQERRECRENGETNGMQLQDWGDSTIDKKRKKTIKITVYGYMLEKKDDS